MVIDNKTLETWKKLRSHGDGKRIAELNPTINDMDISRAFKLGRCSDEIFVMISKYYKNKRRKMASFIRQ